MCELESEDLSEKFINIELELNQRLKTIIFSQPINHIYYPIDYAFEVHSKFIHKYCNIKKTIMILSLNPGPWGMCQTGVPFGEISLVRDWLELEGRINCPENQHSKRKIEGFLCKRSEVSGKRFWSLFKDICETPENFFKNSFVYNYCPIAFMDANGKNITPAEMKQSSAKKELLISCDDALKRILKLLNIKIIIAVGKFAEKKAEELKTEIDQLKEVVVFFPEIYSKKLKNLK